MYPVLNRPPPVTVREELPLKPWLTAQLQQLLGFEAGDIANHVMSLDTDEEAAQYLYNFLGDEKRIKRFVATFLEKRKRAPRERRVEVPDDVKVYKKSTKEDDGIKKAPKQKNPDAAGSKKRGNKQQPVNLQDLDNMVMPGRRSCDCQAARHALLTNCLGCGKVVCMQEGFGPCLFCNFYVRQPGGGGGGAHHQAPAAQSQGKKTSRS
eukprot:TRINITY_DN6849_c0_g3_i2.p1 TRINITY_DN6849_c0_g3~~TRINITY_DN6849_c0_g3_i2.p1  ORF type:complete len:227 (+),score=30.64 TRINITY_DN6849_c0_g3_i2:60-683(+)